MVTLNALTLTFDDANLERAFTAHTHARTLQQGRVAIVVGVLLYLLYGVLDRWFVPPAVQSTIWTIRLIALTVPVTVYALMRRPVFTHHGHVLLALIGLAAGTGCLFIFPLLPVGSISFYYPGMVLITFFTYNLVGTRFAYALAVDVILLVSYNALFGVWKSYPLPMLLSHDFFIVSANLIGGAAGYLQEYQRRQLFLRERELEQQRQEHLQRSLHDALTGLPNRELLHDRIAQALAHSHRDGIAHAAFFVDLDGFKEVNDELGHDAGDLTLRQVAAALTDATRDADTVSRRGGDEFFVLAYGIGRVDDAKRQAERMLACIRAISVGTHRRMHLSASIGVCTFPYRDATVSDIVRRADQAMYLAKKAGKNTYVVADESGDVRMAANA